MAPQMISLRVDKRGLERIFQTQPVITYRHMRDFLDHAFRSFRKNFILRTGINLPNNAVAGINAGTKYAFVFTVAPKAKEIGSKDANTARAALQQLRGEAYTNVPSMRAHEEGATIRAKGKKLAVPILLAGRRNPLPTPAGLRKQIAGRKRNSRKLLVLNRGGRAILFERMRWRTGERKVAELTKSGKLKKKQRKTFEDVLIPRYRLVDSVKLKPQLNFYRTWDELEGDRVVKFKNAATRLVNEIEKAGALAS